MSSPERRNKISRSKESFSVKSSTQRLIDEEKDFLKNVERREFIIELASREFREIRKRGAVSDEYSSDVSKKLEEKDKLSSKENISEQNILATRIALGNIRLLPKYLRERNNIFNEGVRFLNIEKTGEMQDFEEELIKGVADIEALDVVVNSERESEFQKEFAKANKRLSKEVIKAQKSGLKAAAIEIPNIKNAGLKEKSSSEESFLVKKKSEGEVLADGEKEFVLKEADRQLTIQLMRNEIVDAEGKIGISKSRISDLRERLRKINQPVVDTPGFRNVVAKTAIENIAKNYKGLWPEFLRVFKKEMELFRISSDEDIDKDTRDKLEELAINRAVEDTVNFSEDSVLKYKGQTLKVSERLKNALIGAKDIALGVIEEMAVFEGVNKKSMSKK